MPTVTINFLAVIVATVAHQALGFLWYGPLFGKTWTKAMGKTMDQLGNPTKGIITSGVAALVTAFALAVFAGAMGAADMASGIWVGLVAGIGFVATTSATSAAYEGTARTVTLLFIGYQLIGMMIMGAILGAWR